MVHRKPERARGKEDYSTHQTPASEAREMLRPLVQQERTSGESDGHCKSRERSITIGSRMGARNLCTCLPCIQLVSRESCSHVVVVWGRDKR